MRLYAKLGRRYVEWGDVQRYDADQDLMRAGTWRMTFCPRTGEHRYRYDVQPDTASFIAAAEIARDAMERAIFERAKAQPDMGATPYTKRQQQVLEQARQMLSEAGLLWPVYWRHTTPYELAEVAIQAVRQWGKGASNESTR